MTQLAHSDSGDNNQISFHLCQKVKKSENILSKIVWKPMFSFYLFENALNPQRWSVFKRKEGKPLQKYYPAEIGTEFSHKFMLDAKVQNSVFWEILYSRIFCKKKSRLKGEWDFPNTKIFRKCKIKGSQLS